MIAGVFILQLAFTGYQSFSNEQALEQGKEVVLELQPLDPRSMLQGDYVQLQYEAGRFKPADDIESGTVITVKLKKDSSGIYRPTGETAEGSAGDVFKKPQADEAYLTGKYNGYDGLIFGIESFFVEEGTGMELERTAKYAKVIVSDEGNALLVDVKRDISSLK